VGRPGSWLAPQVKAIAFLAFSKIRENVDGGDETAHEQFMFMIAYGTLAKYAPQAFSSLSLQGLRWARLPNYDEESSAP